MNLLKIIRKSKLSKFFYGFEDLFYMFNDWQLYLKNDDTSNKMFWNNLNTICYNQYQNYIRKIWVKYHKKSEELASKAQINTSRLNNDVWLIFQQGYYYKAAQKELEALNHLSSITKNPSRTLSIVAVSAVNLLYKAGEIEEARTKAIRWIADNRCLEFARQELQELLTLSR